MSQVKSAKVIIVFLAILGLTVTLAISASAQARYKTLYTFPVTTIDGYPHDARLILDWAGDLYGTNSAGGDYDYGMVYELKNVGGTWIPTVLHSFDWTDGAYPRGQLLFDATGNLYGTASYGGGTSDCYFTGDCGVLFKLAPNSDGTWTESVLHVFTGLNGDASNTDGGLMFDAAGNLYGTGQWGGAGMGAVFQFTPNSDETWRENMLLGFSGSSRGGYPWSDTLVADAAGNLYGTAAFGGKPGCSQGNGCYGLGLLFELSPNSDGTWTEKVLHLFTAGKDGATPTGPLLLDSAGNLYGTTFWGGAFNGNGNVFKFVPNPDGTWTEFVLHQFTGGIDGALPFSGVIMDSAGSLYGTTTKGGTDNCGVVFKISPSSSGWKYTVLHTFTNNPAGYPYAGLVMDRKGNLYGTTMGDGITTFGSVYKITP